MEVPPGILLVGIARVCSILHRGFFLPLYFSVVESLVILVSVVIRGTI